MINVYMGIDPGKTGALALITKRPDMDPVYEVHDLIQDGVRVLPVLLSHLPGTRNYKCLLESLESSPTWSPSFSGKYGAEHGYVQGVLDCNKWVEYSIIRPNKWKPYYGIGRDKKEALVTARSLAGDLDGHLSLQKHHNRAEAILIAQYLMENPDG